VRRTLLAAVLIFSTGPARSQSQPDPATAQPTGQASSQSSSSPEDEDDIQTLKASVRELQSRLDQLSASPDETKAPTRWPLSANWNHGLEVTSQDDAFRIHVGGNLQFDYGWNAASQAVQFGPGGTGEFQDGALMRRARIRIDGTMFEHIDWVAEYDFANTVENDSGASTQTIGTPSFINAWAGINDIPLVGTIRMGWMKEPISFEYLKSGRFLNFMERTPGTNSFFTRSVGVMFLNTTENERVTWAFGVFHAENDNFGFGFGDGQYSEVGRLTWLPWYEDEGQRLLHLGIGAKHGDLDQNEIDFRGRPSVRTMPGSLIPALANTGTIGGSNQDMLDVELAAVYGPWTVQSEYYCTFVHDAIVPNAAPPKGVPLGTLFYQGTYVEMLYFLTGEYQPYDLKQATFGRVMPRRNFNIWGDERGCGAWQIGIRYGYLDLQNKGVNGATLNDIVVGLNWFLNPNAKIQWNLAIDHRESTPLGSSGWTYIFGSRLAIDF
jgi:phosphate-selective porin OprO/OprP